MPRTRHLVLLFFLSGLSGLVYESMWSRYLRLFVGSAATAQVLVLALFMGGLSIGALLAGRVSARLRRPVLAYGVVEGLIGGLALLFPAAFSAVTRLCYDQLFPAIDGALALQLVKWSAAGALVLLPCVLLGMTFPLLSVGILRRERARSGEILASLYFVNSAGAAVGAIVSGSLSVPALGLPGTMAAAGALNLLIFAVAVRERGVDPHFAIAAGPVSDSPAGVRPPGGRDRLGRLVLGVSFVTGASSFLYEVGWMRLLAMILGSATRSFELMLSAFVLGLALGGAWVRRRIEGFADPLRALGVVQVVMGVAAVLSLPLHRLGVHAVSLVFWDEVPDLSMWVAFNLVRYLVALGIMLPATFCAGMTLPLATHLLLRRGESERAIGRVYGINTLGAILGAVLGALVLMPVVGLGGVILLGAALDLAVGVALVSRSPGAALGGGRARLAGRATRRALAVMAMALALGFVSARPDPRRLAAGVFRHGRTELGEEQVTLSHVDGRTATVTVMEDRSRPGYRTLYTNGKADASVRLDPWPQGRDAPEGPTLALDAVHQILVGALPLLARPDARNVAMIGMGSGVSSHVLLASPTLARLDTVEIEPEMTRAARLLAPVNARVFADPRSQIVHDDAKAHFAAAKRRYELIVSQPSNPWVSGVASLFTVEFYDEVARHLAPGGLFAQWIHGYELDDALLFSVLAAVDRSFGDYRIYRIGDRDWMILAAREGRVPPLDARPLAWPALAAELEPLGIHALAQLEALRVADRALLHAHLHERTANRDARPILDLGAERARFFQRSSDALLALRFVPLPVQEAFGGAPAGDYPAEGIPAGWADRHVLAEPERARALLRAWARPDAPVGTESTSLRQLRSCEAALDGARAEPCAWRSWFALVYDLYNQIAPWLALADTPWWQAVVARAHAAPEPIHRAIALLDAATRRDGEALGREVEWQLAREEDLFDPRLVALAGAVALGLEVAPAEERERFAAARMDGLGHGGSADDLAFRIVRDALRGGEGAGAGEAGEGVAPRGAATVRP